MYLVVNRVCLIINMTIANLCLEVGIGIVVYLLGLLVTKASIMGEAQKLIKNKTNRE